MTPEARRLWVIDPSLSTTEDQGVEELLRGWDGESRLLQPAFGSGPTVADGYDFEAAVVMGSAASVYDPLPWLLSLREWLQPLIHGEVKRAMLGICFGHQLIAEIAGARVAFLAEDHHKRVGIEETRLRDSRLVGQATLRVVVSHREAVCAGPAGFRVTASRPGVPIDGLEHEQLPIFSYQFHPEARGDFAARAGIAVQEIDARLCHDSRLVIDGFYRHVGLALERVAK